MMMPMQLEKLDSPPTIELMSVTVLETMIECPFACPGKGWRVIARPGVRLENG